MNKTLLLIILFVISKPLFSQVTVAEDWTKTDCSGADHTLFSELDEGKVVIMELVMLGGCAPCINAAHLMQPVVDFYNDNYANRVNWYSMGFDNSFGCPELIDWKTENDINNTASFVEGADQISYYGGMGMPTIIVVGRNSHQVYYNKFGFVASDTANFADAIEYALGIAEPLGIEQPTSQDLKIYPNPVSNILYLQNPPKADFTLSIFSITGSELLQTNTSQLNINSLAQGMYLARVICGDVTFVTQFIKK